MFEMALSMNDLATFFLLVGLELVLGIDNVLLISIVTGRLPENERAKARKIALGLAFILRVLFVMGAAYLTQLTDEVMFGLSAKGIILILGGGFLLYKAVKEIHHVVEGAHAEEGKASKIVLTFSAAITQLVLLDAVFSLDSVITAVGLTPHVPVIISSVIVSFLIVLIFAQAVGDFVAKHPALKILALSFLVTIGVTLFIEGMNFHVPKGYIYLPMGFALVVELLQMRFQTNSQKTKRP